MEEEDLRDPAMKRVGYLGACAYSLWLERRCRSTTPLPHSLCPLPRSRSGALNRGELGPGSGVDWAIR